MGNPFAFIDSAVAAQRAMGGRHVPDVAAEEDVEEGFVGDDQVCREVVQVDDEMDGEGEAAESHAGAVGEEPDA